LVLLIEAVSGSILPVHRWFGGVGGHTGGVSTGERTDRSEIDTLVWDIGQVLIRWDREHLYRKLIADDAERERFLADVVSLEFNVGIDLGRPLAEATRELAARHPEWTEEILAFDSRSVEMYPGPVPGTAEIVKEAAQRGDLTQIALSNFSLENMERIRHDHGVLDLLDALVLSGEVGMVKPDRAIFDHLCATHGVVPERAVFIDDSPPNIATADSLGFSTVLFADAVHLRRTLVELGVLNS